MPVIARFYGLIIKMFLLGSEHNPPHIYVVYGEYSALFDIQILQMLEGDLPARAEAMVKEWLVCIRMICLKCGKRKNLGCCHRLNKE